MQPAVDLRAQGSIFPHQIPPKRAFCQETHGTASLRRFGKARKILRKHIAPAVVFHPHTGGFLCRGQFRDPKLLCRHTPALHLVCKPGKAAALVGLGARPEPRLFACQHSFFCALPTGLRGGKAMPRGLFADFTRCERKQRPQRVHSRSAYSLLCNVACVQRQRKRQHVCAFVQPGTDQSACGALAEQDFHHGFFLRLCYALSIARCA